jgi:hypothetical protein
MCDIVPKEIRVEAYPEDMSHPERLSAALVSVLQWPFANSLR